MAREKGDTNWSNLLLRNIFGIFRLLLFLNRITEMKKSLNYLNCLQAMYGEHYFKKLGFVLWDVIEATK